MVDAGEAPVDMSQSQGYAALVGIDNILERALRTSREDGKGESFVVWR